MEDLSKKSDNELKESLQRQKNLLANKHVVSKLKDGGLKIKNFKIQMEEELARRNEDAGLQNVAFNSALYVTATESLEWTGRYATDIDGPLDSDDDSSEETDPLKIIAEHGGTSRYKKIYRTNAPDESLIKVADIQETSHFVDSSSDEVYSSHLCFRDETTKKSTRIPFKPHSTVKSPSSSSHGYKKPKGPHWEVTSATPPDYAHGDAKPVSLSESLKLQREHATRLKEGQSKQAADRLAAQIERMYLSERRNSDASTVEEADIDAEHGDEDETEDRGIVIYSLVD